MTKFAFLCDLHYGYERRSGHKVPLHDIKAFNAVLSFLKEFKPDHLILGGDILDCSAVSHHNHGKPGRTEGMRLFQDAQECREKIITPLRKLNAKNLYYIMGNHEDWVNDLVDDMPALGGLVEVERLLELDDFTVIPQGGHVSVGKLTFVHGDQIKGGEHVAKSAVISYERSVRFGHHHTYQVYTKTSALDIKLGRTGVAVPCLCTKAPKYGEGNPNRWQQGFNWGYILNDGTYRDYVSIIIDGRLVVDGKVYSG